MENEETALDIIENEVEIEPANEQAKTTGLTIEPIAMGPLSADGVATAMTTAPTTMFRDESEAMNEKIKWNIDPKLQIDVNFTVSFMSAFTFDMTVFGKAVV